MSFYLSKILWEIFNPLNTIVILFIFSFVSSIINLNLISKFLKILGLLFFIIFGILPTGSYLNYILEKDFFYNNELSSDIKGMVILSGATNPYLTKEHQKVSLGGSVERLTESIQIIKNNPSIKIIFSGGPAYINHPNLNDSDSAKIFFSQMGVDISKIIFEDNSRNTYENILFSKEIAKPKIDEKWIVITSASHMRRTINVSNKLNWKLIPYPTDFNVGKKFKFNISYNFLQNFNHSNKAVHEWVGLVYYYLLGKTNQI